MPLPGFAAAVVTGAGRGRRTAARAPGPARDAARPGPGCGRAGGAGCAADRGAPVVIARDGGAGGVLDLDLDGRALERFLERLRDLVVVLGGQQSLSEWQRTGTITRELALYQELAKGYGETLPTVKIDGLKRSKLKAARAKNRRVEFKLQ